MTTDEQIRWIGTQMHDPEVGIIVGSTLKREGLAKMSDLKDHPKVCAQLYRGIADMIEQDDILEDFRAITEPLRSERES